MPSGRTSGRTSEPPPEPAGVLGLTAQGFPGHGSQPWPGCVCGPPDGWPWGQWRNGCRNGAAGKSEVVRAIAGNHSSRAIAHCGRIGFRRAGRLIGLRRFRRRGGGRFGVAAPAPEVPGQRIAEIDGLGDGRDLRLAAKGRSAFARARASRRSAIVTNKAAAPIRRRKTRARTRRAPTGPIASPNASRAADQSSKIAASTNTTVMTPTITRRRQVRSASSTSRVARSLRCMNASVPHCCVVVSADPCAVRPDRGAPPGRRESRCRGRSRRS